MPDNARYTIEREADVKQAEQAGTYGGEKAIDMYRYDFAGAALPARFVVYELPPGASEGIHVHHRDNRNGHGAFDEFYYIVSGAGVMAIDGERVTVRAGDQVHAPLGVAHGIENTDPSEPLKVFLTFIERGTPLAAG
jgi:mannose-6-phosphate isomerase-like protein (cupin superfamily)